MFYPFSSSSSLKLFVNILPLSFVYINGSIFVAEAVKVQENNVLHNMIILLNAMLAAVAFCLLLGYNCWRKLHATFLLRHDRGWFDYSPSNVLSWLILKLNNVYNFVVSCSGYMDLATLYENDLNIYLVCFYDLYISWN